MAGVYLGEKYLLQTQPDTLCPRLRARSGISDAEMDTRSDLSSTPSPTLHHPRPHPPSSLAPCLWSCRCHSPFFLALPLPPATHFQGQTPLHHYAGMDNSDGGGASPERVAWGVRGDRGRDDRQKAG